MLTSFDMMKMDMMRNSIEREKKWHHRFMDMAKMVASWSKDPSTKTGAVIVSPDKRKTQVGYNGFPQGIEDSPELLGNREEKYKRIIHCEMNAILSASFDLQDCTLYTWPFASCERCAVHVIQSGISTVVSPEIPESSQRKMEG